MIECPRILFPFARQVLASVTQAGGFPPLLMDPVDFSAIYRQNLAALQAQQKPARSRIRRSELSAVGVPIHRGSVPAQAGISV